MTSSPASAAPADGGSVTTTATATMAGGLHVLMTVQGYSKLKEALDDDGGIESERFRFGGHSWYIEHDPASNEDEVTVYICLDDDDGCGGDVTARYELSLLNRDGHIISSTQSFYTFTGTDDYTDAITELNASRLLGDSFQIWCDLTVVVGEIAAVAPPDMHRHLGSLLASQVGGDMTFNVGGELFTAHKCILAARSPVFMADLFGSPPGKENATHVFRINGMEPRVFKALLHFIYTDMLPEMNDEGGDGNDKVAMVQGLIVAADRYGMERLMLICGDIMCAYVDELTAVAMLKLAEKRGCHRLKKVCIKILKELLASVAP
ncbi:unnamed protein product [Urochloa decumbens]|uniref:Uncharacterized protein n=1 Tax=Urochloa decumbens TaxID=240449 RepID=A0ABC9HCJ0_9POAL